MATRKASPTNDERPLLLDEMAMQGDVAPSKEMPDTVARALADERIYIDGMSSEPRATRAAGAKGRSARSGWELELPSGTRLGQAGLTGERLSRPASMKAAAKGVDRTTTPMRPAWEAQTFQPRIASESFRHTPMQRIDGRQVEPYYGVYGTDDRVVYYPSSYPWRCIGRIFTWTNWAGGGGWTWWGSGALVGPRHVLTAAHVCPWGSSSWAMRFVPSYWNGSPAAGAGAQSYASDYRGWNSGGNVAANDYAILRLYNPIGNSLGWLGTKTYSSSWNGGNYWNLAGYPAAVAGGERPSNQGGIPVLDNDNSGDSVEIEHHGDATGGDSGGPFFGFWTDGPYAVGVTSGGERIYNTPFGWWDEDNNIEAGGGGMVNLVRWGLNNWP